MADERYETGILRQRLVCPDVGQCAAGNRKTDPRVRGIQCPRAIHAVSASLRAHVLNPAGPQDPSGLGRRNTSTFLPGIQLRWLPGIQPLHVRPALAVLDA